MDEEEAVKSLKSFDQFLEKAVDDPDFYPDSVSFVPLGLVKKQNLFTPERVRIIQTMKENDDISSMTELAEKLERPISGVSQDCKKLSLPGLISMEKEGSKKVPNLEDDHIIILY